MKNILYALIFLTLCFSIGCSPSQQGNLPNLTQPSENISINGIDFSNLSQQAAANKLTALEQEMLAKKISLSYGTDNWQVAIKDLGVTTNKQEILDNIATKGQGLNTEYSLEYKLDQAQAEAAIQAITAKVNSQAKDAVLQVKAKDNKVKIIPHVVGKSVDVEQTVVNLQQGLSQQADDVPVVVKELPPKIKTKDLENVSFDAPIVTFATSFAPNDKNRTENLKKAAQALDGVTIQPGEVFSFNRIVGPRTEETGYKEALVIEENELVPGIGGGVCQVSSTLYNLALLADLAMVERHHHEFAVRYLPPGRDATVVYGHADLRFKNNTPAILLIRTETKGSSLKMTLYGKKVNKQVEIQTVIDATKPFLTERRLDPKLAPGTVDKSKLGMPGYTVRTFRIVKVNNKLVKKEELHKDVYKPATRIIKVGPSTGRGSAP